MSNSTSSVRRIDKRVEREVAEKLHQSAGQRDKGETMKVMVLVKATEDSENGVMPSEQLLKEMGDFNEELVSAGIMLDGDGLRPSSQAARIEFTPEGTTVTDGPFAETKELVAGYWVWQVKSMEEAIEWVRRVPNPDRDMGQIEIRQFFSPEDFGEAFTPELQEQEQTLRDRISED
jgi:hypothetical protein